MGRVADDITVVIPVYNREKELARCLDSIAAQTCLPARVIVVDDGSSDSTVVVAREHPLRPEVKETAHGGAAAARNVGLAHVETGWTMFFDSDDVMGPRHIESAASAISDNVDIVGWDVTEVSFDGRERVLRFEVPDIEWHNIMHGSMATLRYMARTELFRKAGGWNEKVRIWDDVELGMRLLRLHPRLTKINERNALQMCTTVSITGANWKDNFDKYATTFEAFRENIGYRHSDWIALKQAILAADVWREDREKGREIYEQIPHRSAAVRFAYHYRRRGLRGAARLLRMFFSK